MLKARISFCSNPATSMHLPEVRKQHRSCWIKVRPSLQMGRKLFNNEGITAQLRSIVCALRDARVVHHVCSKPNESRGLFNSLPDLGHVWVQELSSMLSCPVGRPADWAKSKDPAPAAPQEKATAGVKVFSSSGDWANSAGSIAAKRVGADQRPRPEDKVYTLQSIT